MLRKAGRFLLQSGRCTVVWGVFWSRFLAGFFGSVGKWLGMGTMSCPSFQRPLGVKQQSRSRWQMLSMPRLMPLISYLAHSICISMRLIMNCR